MPKKGINKNTLRSFIMAVRSRVSIDLPLIAKEQDLPFLELQRRLQKQDWFYEEMKIVLQEIKYILLDKILTKAKGTRGRLEKPDIRSCQVIIDAIDRDLILLPRKRSLEETEESIETIEDEVEEDEDINPQELFEKAKGLRKDKK